jgi:hypothetical protein
MPMLELRVVKHTAIYNRFWLARWVLEVKVLLPNASRLG